MPLAERASAGHQLGIALVAMVFVLLAAGLAIGFASAQRAPSLEARRQAGVLVLILLALVPVAFVGALALSSRGLGGSLSNGWRNLTDPHANGNIANSPDRLTAVASVRARYWNEALKIAKAHKALGVGAGGYATVRPRYRADTLDVRHAHGYVVQTLADLGAVGMGVSLALLAAWLAAATRTVGLWGPGRHAPWTPERVGMATLLSVCVVFGVHSFVDWTWFVPGNAVLALLCAGWLAGRGPTVEPIVRLKPARLTVREPWRIGLAVVAVAVALVAAWTSWQPQRAVAEGSDALSTAEALHFKQARAQIAQRRAHEPAVGRPALPAGGHRARRRQHGRRAQRAAGGGAQGAREPGHLAGARRVRAQRGPQAAGALGRRLGALPRPPLAGGDHHLPAGQRPPAVGPTTRSRAARGRRAARPPTRSPRRRGRHAGCAR